MILQDKKRTAGYPVFLDLPPEIRNNIYEHALVEKEPIALDQEQGTYPAIPGLLSVCRQIRNEASAIWYMSNDFVFVIEQCDARLLNAWVGHCRDVGFPNAQVDAELHAPGFWDNLLDWCHIIKSSSERAFQVHKQEDMDDFSMTVAEAHHIALKHVGGSWKECVDEINAMGRSDPDIYDDWYDLEKEDDEFVPSDGESEESDVD